MTKLSVDTFSKLQIATRTNTPITAAPEEFQSELVKVATKYINLYARRYTAHDVAGLMEVLPIVKNRIENLTVAGIEDGSISKPADVQNLLKGNASMEALEEKAIIEAYHNGVSEAALYVYLFFSFKVYDFMNNSKLFGASNDDDMYAALQAYLYTLIENFDFNIVKNGGLSTKYYRQAMMDYVREELIGKQNAMFTLNRRQVSDLRKAQRITPHDSKTLSYKEIAKKYNIAEVAVSLHFIIMSTVRLDSACIDSDGFLSDNYDNFAAEGNVYEEVETPLVHNQMLNSLEKGGIDAVVASSILDALLNYANQSLEEKGKVKKASQRVYKNIADEVGVPLKVVETVIHSYGEIFS